MAKDFGKLNNKKIEAVAKKSSESANVITVKMIGVDDLLDYPKNNEDVSMTEDLELSMKQNGFTDPIEVTTFGCEDGKYIIVSGHRRKYAGIKVGIKTFPCIVKTFKNEADVFNYVLLANSQRDSAKDPLLFCKRYKMHEECLKEQGFKGNLREEIAKRLGLSIQQADRYNQMNKVILPVWDMVREEKVGMSSVLAMSNFFPEHQEEIVVIFNQCIEAGQRLSREVCKTIIDGYKKGKKSYLEIIQIDMNMEQVSNEFNGMNKPIKGEFINTEPTETKEDKPKNRNDEINYDTSHREGLGADDSTNKFDNEKPTEDDYNVINMASRQGKQDGDKKEPMSDEEKKLHRGKQINDTVAKLDKLLSEHFGYDNEEEALLAMQGLSSIVKVIFEGMQYITNGYEDDMDDKFRSLLTNIQKDLNSYIED